MCRFVGFPAGFLLVCASDGDSHSRSVKRTESFFGLWTILVVNKQFLDLPIHEEVRHQLTSRFMTFSFGQASTNLRGYTHEVSQYLICLGCQMMSSPDSQRRVIHHGKPGTKEAGHLERFGESSVFPHVHRFEKDPRKWKSAN